MERAAHAIATTIVDHPKLCLSAALVVTVVAGVAASGLRFDSSYRSMLPPDEPRILEADAVRARTGGQRQLVIAVSGPDAERRAAFGRALADDIERLPQIRWVDAELPVAWFEARALWLLEEDELEALVEAVGDALDREAAARHPLSIALDADSTTEDAWARVRQRIDANRSELHRMHLESRDGRYTFVVVTPTVTVMDFEGSNALFSGIERAVRSLREVYPDVEVRYAGKFQLARDQHTVLTADMRRASLLALALCLIVIALVTRRLAAPLIVVGGVVLGLVWTLAAARLLVGSLNLISAFLVPVLIGLGADFGIHLVVRYGQERAERPARAARIATVAGLLPPSFVSALTTAGTFAVLTLSDFRGFSELGVVAAVGVLLTFVVSFLAVPPMLGRFGGATTPVSGGARVFPRRAAVLVVIALSIGALFGAVRATDVRFDNDYRRLRTDSDEVEFFRYVDENLGLRFDPTVVVVDDLDAARAVHRAIAAEGVGRVLSIVDLLPRTSPRRRELLDELDALLSRRAYDGLRGDDAELLARARAQIAQAPWSVDEIPATVRRRLMTLDGEGCTVLFWPETPITSDAAAWVWAERLDRIGAPLDAEGVTHLMATETLTPSWVHQRIVADAPKTITLAALVVLLITAASMRTVRRTLLVCVPLVVAVTGTLGVMVATGLDLDMFNLIVLPTVLGIGIDNLVHLVHRYERCGPGSMPFVWKRTGQSVLLTSVTTAIGFGAMLVAHHAGLRSLGTLALIAIGATLLAAAVYLPALLVMIDRAAPDRVR